MRGRGVIGAASLPVRSSRTPTGTTIVNCAPPSVPVLCPDASVLDRQQAADDPQAHAGARRARPGRRRRDRTDRTGAAGRPARSRGPDREPRSSTLRPSRGQSTSIVDPGGEYCAAFSSRCASAVAVSRGSSRTGTSGSMSTSTLCSRSVCSTWSRAAATISDGCVHRDSVATAPASMRAISRRFWNSRREPLDLRQDQVGSARDVRPARAPAP